MSFLGAVGVTRSFNVDRVDAVVVLGVAMSGMSKLMEETVVIVVELPPSDGGRTF